ncbi:MAG TPA: cytidylate kinase-like family protein [Bryobacteraceae bacterium]|jgi:cytidylate kinase|nr:cytidylate kinase-like family protein [Bryobacteraceae bacterium]
MINVISIEREYGTGACSIANQLAERLGFKVWDQLLTEEIAKRLHCDVRAVEQREERLDPTYYRLIKTFMRGSFEDRTGARYETLDAEGLLHLFDKVINEIANKGKCIIVGRGAPWFLRDRTDTCHVFLYASHEEKLRRVQAFGKRRDEAEELINRVDAERAAYVKKYHEKTWPSRELYHLMVNTKMGDRAVVELILHQIELLNKGVAATTVTSGAA